MKFELTSEQRLLSEALSGQIERLCGQDAVRRFADTAHMDKQLAAGLAEMGLFGLLCDPASGGMGLGASEAVLAGVAMGRYLLPYPAAEAMLAARIAADYDPMLGERIASGELLVTLSPRSGLSFSGDQLSGQIGAVPWAGEATLLIVPVADGPRRQWAAFEIASAGVSLGAPAGVDLTAPAAAVSVAGIPRTAVMLFRDAPDLDALGAMLTAAQAVGAAAKAFEMTLEYVRTREQFGRKVGSFQAIKHILSQDAVLIESMRVALAYAAWAFDAQAADALQALHVTKSYVSTSARKVCEDAIQCHGGIGFTWDYPLHLHLRRVLAHASAFGSAFEHRAAIAKMLDAGMVDTEMAA